MRATVNRKVDGSIPSLSGIFVLHLVDSESFLFAISRITPALAPG